MTCPSTASRRERTDVDRRVSQKGIPSHRSLPEFPDFVFLGKARLHDQQTVRFGQPFQEMRGNTLGSFVPWSYQSFGLMERTGSGPPVCMATWGGQLESCLARSFNFNLGERRQQFPTDSIGLQDSFGFNPVTFKRFAMQTTPFWRLMCPSMVLQVVNFQRIFLGWPTLR